MIYLNLIIVIDWLKNMTFFGCMRSVGIILFIWIASQINWASVWLSLMNMQLSYLVACFIIFMFQVLLKVIRLLWFLNKIKCNVKFRALYQCVVECGLYGMVTPARVGEFSKIFYLAKFGLTRKQATGAVLLERGVDFLVLLIVSLVGVLHFFALHAWEFWWEVIILIILYFVLYFSLSNLRIMLGIFPKSWRSSRLVVSVFGHNYDYLNSMGKLAAHIFLPTSFCILALSFLSIFFMALGLGIVTNGVILGLAYTSSSLISLLPISIAGMGTRESIYIVLLQKEGISPNAAITLSLLDGLVLPILALTTFVLIYSSIQRLMNIDFNKK